MTRTILFATLLLAACGRPEGAPDIIVAQAWTRESAGPSAAAYFAIANFGDGPDRLVSVAVPPPAKAALRTTINADRIARMRPIEGLEIPAHQSITLGPGETHVMVTGLQSPLRAGETLRLTLRFERSGERQVTAVVRPAAGIG